MSAAKDPKAKWAKYQATPAAKRAAKECRTVLVDADDIVIAEVSRGRTPEGDGYVAIRRHDDLITISLADVPAFLRAIMKAAS